jgi:cell division protein FtsN
MARNKQARKSPPGKKGGGMLFSLLAGLIIGLGVAAVVAYYVTQTPMPFADKASRAPAQTLLPDVRDAPDPNIGLNPAQPPAPGGVSTPQPLPDGQTGDSGKDGIAELLATLGAAQQQDQQNAPRQAPSPAPAPAPAPKPAATVAQAAATYYLQAGAFSSETEAQSVRGRILMLGMQVQVQPAQVNGAQLYRVRVGPFQGLDEMNRSRARLGEAKIESSVVRP